MILTRRQSRPPVPILHPDKIEVRKDARYSMSIEKIKSLEKKHILEMPNLSRPDDFYLLHQSDFCTLFDRVNNRPKAVYATVQGPVRSMDTKLFSIKRVDPRVHLTNSGESPLFRPELATTRSSAVECWISTNMVSIRGRGYEIFVTQILPKLIGNRKVNIVIIPQFSEETNTEVTAIKFVMTIVDKKEWSVFQVQVSDMSQLTNPGIDFKSWFARHH